MADIFISHSSKDKEIADKLCEAMEAKGLKCWIAPRDIVPGSEWAVSISDAISTISAMVVIYSENSAASTQVPKELGLADKRGKFIIPYKIDDMELTGAFDYYLAGAHWIVANPKNKEYKFDELYGVMSGVMQLPATTMTNNTYIDTVNIHAPSHIEVHEPPRKNVNTLLLGGILAGVLLVVVLLVGGSILRKDENRELESESKETLLVEKTDDSGQTSIGNVEIAPKNEEEASTESTEETVEAAQMNFVYEIKNGEATIVGFRGNDENVKIPSSIDGVAVTYIAEDAFYQCTNIKSVEIPESVVEIGQWAFAETGLQKVIIPASVRKIGDAAFCRCKNLEEVRLFNGVKEIGEGAFSETAIKDIVLPNSLTIVGDSTFSKCTKLVSATLSSNLTEIADYMFNGCTSFGSLNIPLSVTVMGDFAFSQTVFENVNLAETNIIQIGGGTFSECSNLKNVTLPNTLVKLDDGAFQMCMNLETVVLPEGIKSISYNAFYDCKNVKITKGEKVYDFDTYLDLALELSDKLAGDFQYETLTDGIWITNYIGDEDIVVIPNSINGEWVTGIGEKAFSEYKKLSFLSIPQSVTQIGNNAFADCRNLRTVAGGGAVKTLGYGIYRGTAIQQIEVPEGQEQVGYCAFYGCPNLVSVHIPEGVSLIDEYAFAGCGNLTELWIPGSVAQIAGNAFDDSVNLTLIYGGYRYRYEERHQIPVMLETVE